MFGQNMCLSAWKVNVRCCREIIIMLVSSLPTLLLHKQCISVWELVIFIHKRFGSQLEEGSRSFEESHFIRLCNVIMSYKD